MRYIVKKPRWIRPFYGKCTWEICTTKNILFLTFDDGPSPLETEFVLSELEKYNARATFFCIGKNIVTHPGIYKKIIDNGHAAGNHTYSHPDGWFTKNPKFIHDIKEAGKYLNSKLFRPPYGHITWRLNNKINKNLGMKTIMWDVLSGDFDSSTSTIKCFENVINNAVKGSIIVFHDSPKAAKNLRYALPRVLEHFSARGFRFESLNFQNCSA